MDRSSPEAVVQRQLDAYTAREVEAWLATYAPDACQYAFPDTPLARGHDAMRTRIAARFREPDLHAELLHRAVVGDRVMDHEHITRTLPGVTGTMEMICVYEVREGRIARAWFIAGEAVPTTGGS